MNRNLNPTVPPNNSLKKFFAAYEKMVNDSRSFACKMAAAIKRDSKKPKNADQLS